LSKTVDTLIVKKPQAVRALRGLEERLAEGEAEKRLRVERLKKGKVLRAQGLTYREIGRKLNVDFGYMRRLILGKI
jgi:hypothetical protein